MKPAQDKLRGVAIVPAETRDDIISIQRNRAPTIIRRRADRKPEGTPGSQAETPGHPVLLMLVGGGSANATLAPALAGVKEFRVTSSSAPDGARLPATLVIGRAQQI